MICSTDFIGTTPFTRLHIDMDWYQITLIIGTILAYLGFKIDMDHNSGPLDMLFAYGLRGAGIITLIVGGIGWMG